MKKKSSILLAFFAVCFAVTSSSAQSLITVTGNVKNKTTKESVPAVSITIKGGTSGAYTDEKGNFKFATTQKLPFTLIVGSVGFTSKEVEYTTSGQVLNIEIEASFALGQDIVVAASRLPERILESPVSIERVNAATIRNAPGANYYDALGNLKGVDVTTSSYTFKTVSTRGFNGSGNLRFNQLVDGMDNSAPSFNFSVSNVIGVTELDVDNMELLSGASSALYGSGGMNGTLLINSKNPFKYQGLSFQVKQGIMHVGDSRSKATPFYDWSLRWGKKISDKFAFKIGAEYTKADDWQADDYSNLLRNNVISGPKGGDRSSDANYDGVNVFGDEVSASLSGIAQAGVFGPANTSLGLVIGALGINAADGLNATERAQILTFYSQQSPTVYGPLPAFSGGLLSGAYIGADGKPILASRTGYNEKDIVNYDAYNIKFSAGVYYKVTANTEVSLFGNWGLGTTVYTGADRYSLKNFQLGQYKLEFKNPNWFLKAYTTQENSGDSYASTLAAITINRKWKDDGTWFGTYSANYAGARLLNVPVDQANALSRAAADAGRYVPGTTEFKTAFDQAIKTKITSAGGAQFADKSDVYQFEGQYNFSSLIKVIDVLVGASYRLYHLNSNGTIFADTANPINIGEVGGYVQLSKKLFNDVLKLQASGRYDKNENFDGRFTPRITASIKVAKDNNIRLSFQQAYRFPTNQDQWINLQTPGTRLIGCLPDFNTFFGFESNPTYTAESVVKYRSTFNPADLVKATFATVKPEVVNSFEVGYRGIITKKLLIDIYYYNSKYKDFIARQSVVRGASGSAANYLTELASPFTSTNYSFVVNSPTPVKANGWGFGGEYKVGLRGYTIMANIYGDQLTGVPDSLVTFFNTPKTRFNLGLANPNVYKGIGFNIIYKWQDKIDWQGTFAAGQVPSFGTLDAQVSYKPGKSKNLIKLGATNLFNNYYRNSFGNPYVGGLYYVSFGFNVF
ncbi:MAG TPA: TonB-dependent receptor [Panacibacter sp.]|nr:TonB-dependent receptor [Panacibacter sp.]